MGKRAGSAVCNSLLRYSLILSYFSGEETSTVTVLQHHHNILHCHNITERWKEVKVVFMFPKDILRVQRQTGEKDRGCSVSDPTAWWLSVKGDELCLCMTGHSLRSLLLLLWRWLLLWLWATRGSHLANRSSFIKHSMQGVKIT